MADLSYIDATQEVKIVGQDSTGTRANYVGADANGNLTTKDYADGPVSPGTVALASALIGAQYNTSLPTLTNTQQSALQADSSGRLIVRNSEFPATIDTNYGTVGASTIRTASQIGNATGGADFAAGNSSAQTLRVVVASNQVAIPVSQSGTWTVQQGTPPWTIQGDSASGASKAGNPVQIGGVFNTTQPTVTTGQTVEAQSTARGALIVATGVDNFNINNISGTISLPTGAATSALQTTGNTSLSTIATNTTQLAQGSTTSGELGTLIMGAVTTAAPTYTTAKTDPLSLNTSGGLRVDGSGVTQPVSGTFWQTTQPVSGTVTADQGGTWTVQPGNTQNTTAWLTQDAADGPVTPGTVASKSQLAGAQYNSTAPTLTTGQQVALQTDASGNLKVTATYVAIVFGALTTGSKSSIGTSAVQISSTSVVASSGITIRSALANSATIYIGPSGVTANTAAATDGIPLNPGESISMPLNNLNLLYVIATATGQEIFWMVI